MYLHEYQSRLGDDPRTEFSHDCLDAVKTKNSLKRSRVAVIGAGFAGLMAARWLGKNGFDVTVFEARTEVGGRVKSNPKFSLGRITEEGAELIGSFHTVWLELAREYGLAMISRMDSNLYQQARLAIKLRLGRDLSMDEFVGLEKEMRNRVLIPLARDARKILDPSRPWLQPGLQVDDLTSVAAALQMRYGVSPTELLWKMLEFKLVNDEVAPLNKMNYLGLLCKVRAGQGIRFRFEDKEDITQLTRYWDELEIFRCADGCQALATKMANEIQSKGFQDKHSSKIKLHLRTAVKQIDISQSKGPGVEIGSRKVLDQRTEKLAGGKLDVSRYDYVILAIPPSVWKEVFFAPPPWDPRVEIGVMGMDPAVKFFTDVKDRFWIKKGFAPSGGSSILGQIWEGTDNQIRITVGKIPDPRGGVIAVKQGIVLSVFAGPILPGGVTPKPSDFMKELTSLFPDYPTNQNKTLFSNWPDEPFIKTGYASPRLGEIFKLAQKLNQPFHNLMFFAGEHTRMDFFGYMEGALRSGERAAKQLMLKFCGKEAEPAASRPRVASAA